jgi:hypothetical protein
VGGGETAQYVLPTPRPETVAQPVVAQQLTDRDGERSRILGGHEQSSLSVQDRLGDVSDVRCDDRRLGQKGLEQGQRQPLESGRQRRRRKAASLG